MIAIQVYGAAGEQGGGDCIICDDNVASVVRLLHLSWHAHFLGGEGGTLDHHTDTDLRGVLWEGRALGFTGFSGGKRDGRNVP